MLPWVTVEHARAPDGTDLVLARRGTEWEVRAGGLTSMSSRTHGSESALATLAFEKRPGAKAILLPKKGVSAIDALGQPFDDPEARQALYGAIRESAKGVEIVELDNHINDPEFADAAARKLLDLMKVGKR